MLITSNYLRRSLPGTRTFYAALVSIFNRVSNSRIEAVGPDRACAEWLMRNGAFIRWQGQPNFLSHYDNLPLDENDKAPYYIEEVDATDASISHHGFPHFSGCNYITKMKFHNCWYFDDRCIFQLNLIANSLCQLEITNCGEVTDAGLASLKDLRRLNDLRLGDLKQVKNLTGCVTAIQQALPECSVYILPSTK
uniref:Putative atp synthase subunit s mitochondrial n=1 Tax=Panstrongylus megistus TaxID=65343 RepID=A0A069DPT9_9HEMI